MLHNVSVPSMRVRQPPSRAEKRRNMSYMLYQADICMVSKRRQRAGHLFRALQSERLLAQKRLRA